MATYDDLLIRNTLSDNGTIPRRGAMSSCPDVIPYGTQPIADPKKTFTDTFNQDVGKDIVARAQNYLYVRGKNYKDGPQNGKVSLYYAPSNVLLYPVMWSKNKLKTSNGIDAVPVHADKKGDVFVTDNPFTWSPEKPGPDYHFCLIGLVSTQEHPNTDLPQKTSISDLAVWVANNGGIGWRNVVVTEVGAPTFTTTTPYEQGDEAATVHFAIVCENAPIGAEVSFSAGNQPGGQPIYLPPTPVNTSPTFFAGMITKVNAGFVTNIAYSYNAKGHQPPDNLKISIQATVVDDTGALAHVSTPMRRLGLANSLLYDTRRGWGPLEAMLGPQRAVIVGQHATQYGAVAFQG